MSKRLVCYPLLLVALGCGGGGGGSATSTGSSSGGGSSSSSSVPAPQPGSPPRTIAGTTIRFLNLSSHISTSEWAGAVDTINWQITTDFNPRWGTNAVAQVYTGSLDTNYPTVVIQDRETGAGGYSDGSCGYVAYRDNTMSTWRAYCSHVAINLLTPGYYAGQTVEAYDYRRVDYAEQAPYELADFDFPSKHGLGGTYYDCNGNAAYDLLHKLPYP